MSTKRRGTSGLRVGSTGARDSMSSPTALAACPLAHPVQTVLHYASVFNGNCPASLSDIVQKVSASRPRLRLRSSSSTDYVLPRLRTHSESAPFLTLVRLHGTDCLKTFAQNLTSPTFENFSKLTILILCLTFNKCILSFVMHPWPSCNGRARNAVSMSIWVCTRSHYFFLPLSRLHHFSCLSVGNKQSLCPLMWGAQ